MMVRIGVLADSHGNLALLREAVAILRKLSLGKVYHLGDNYEDAQELEAAGFSVLKVPGIYHPLYVKEQAPRKLQECLEDLEVLLTHAEKDLSEEDLQAADVILVGHTHRFEIRLNRSKVVVNPGQLKSPLDAGRPASFALLEVEGKTCNIKILSPRGELLAAACYHKPGGLHEA